MVSRSNKLLTVCPEVLSERISRTSGNISPHRATSLLIGQHRSTLGNIAPHWATSSNIVASTAVDAASSCFVLFVLLRVAHVGSPGGSAQALLPVHFGQCAFGCTLSAVHFGCTLSAVHFRLYTFAWPLLLSACRAAYCLLRAM